MSMMPDTANAPPMSAGNVPDAQPISLQDALNAALQHLASDPLTPGEMQVFKAFYLASHQILAQKVQMQQQQMGAGGPGAGGPPGGMERGAPAGPAGGGATEDYGAGYGNDVPEWQGASGR